MNAILPAAPFAMLLLDVASEQEELGAPDAKRAAGQVFGLTPDIVEMVLAGTDLPFRLVEHALLREGRHQIDKLYDKDLIKACRGTAKTKGKLVCEGCGTELRTEARLCGFCEAELEGGS